MMFRTKFFFALFLVVFSVASCKKDSYNPEKQLAIDESLIKEFIAKNSIVALRHESGVYYQILAAGSGEQPTMNSMVSVTYEGRLLNGEVFDKASSGRTFSLASLIQGWQIGIPLIKKGGKIRLLIPSTLGYMNQARVGIPSNSVLDFTVDLLNVQ